MGDAVPYEAVHQKKPFYSETLATINRAESEDDMPVITAQEGSELLPQPRPREPTAIEGEIKAGAGVSIQITQVTRE